MSDIKMSEDKFPKGLIETSISGPDMTVSDYYIEGMHVGTRMHGNDIAQTTKKSIDFYDSAYALPLNAKDSIPMTEEGKSKLRTLVRSTIRESGEKEGRAFHFPISVSSKLGDLIDASGNDIGAIWDDYSEEWIDAINRINSHDTLTARVAELEAALKTLLFASIEYVEYEHDGDPWVEDSRVMGEMILDYLDYDGTIESIKKLLEAKS
jgi:uncharacterized protein (DUF433 family)